MSARTKREATAEGWAGTSRQSGRQEGGEGAGQGPAAAPRRGEGQRGTTPIRTPDEGRGGGHLGGDQIEGRHAVREL